MSILIVARTRMADNYRCIGGLIVSQSWKDNYLNSVRLLAANGNHFTSTVDFDVGEFWDVEFSYSNNTEPPHSEDVLVYDWDNQQDCDDLAAFLRGHKPRLAELNRWWEGSPDALFGGRLEARNSGTGYISRGNVPEISTGFWVPDSDLYRQVYDETVRYRYGEPSDVQRLKYVGEGSLTETIPGGTICRVSLARWWTDDRGEECCYLQLSDAYLGDDSNGSQDEEETFEPEDDLPF